MLHAVARAGVLMAALAAGNASHAQGDPCAPTWLLSSEGLRGGARLVGLGGAFVGLADDVSAAASNPSGLLSLPRSLDSWVPLWGTGEPAYSPAYVGIALHPYKDMAVAVDWARTDHQPVHSVPGGCASLAGESGPTFSFSVRAERRIFVGASLGVSRVTLPDDPATGDRLHDWAPRIVLGMFVRPDGTLPPRVGLTYRRRIDWSTSGEASAPGGGPEIRQPSVFSAGVSWHYDLITNARLTFSLQQDFVRYSELNGLAALPAEAGRIRDDFDLRAGIELTHPFGCVSGCGGFLQVRAGVLSRGALPYREPGAVSDPQGQGAARNTSWFGGLSLALPARWAMAGKLKLDAAYSTERDTFLVGLGLRYPESYRADLVANRATRK